MFRNSLCLQHGWGRGWVFKTVPFRELPNAENTGRIAGIRNNGLASPIFNSQSSINNTWLLAFLPWRIGRLQFDAEFARLVLRHPCDLRLDRLVTLDGYLHRAAEQ